VPANRLLFGCKKKNSARLLYGRALATLACLTGHTTGKNRKSLTKFSIWLLVR